MIVAEGFQHDKFIVLISPEKSDCESEKICFVGNENGANLFQHQRMYVA